jgi:hypothetical protein
VIRTLLPLVLLLSACGEKTSAPTATASASTSAPSAQADVPKDAASQSFAAKLLKYPIKDFSPSDNGGVQFSYKTLTFRADNTWSADASMVADGETVDCNESGTWSMDPAENPNLATMDWKLQKTSCAGRPTDEVMHVKVEISNEGEYKILFR